MRLCYKTIIIIIVIITTIAFFTVCDNEKIFKDKILEIVVKNQLSKDSTEILYEEEIKTITELEVLAPYVRTIDGIEKCIRLERFELYHSFVTDVDVLSYLKGLTEVKLFGNLYLGSNIKGLSNLTNLVKLNLDCNNIEDISSLANLYNLEELSLQVNKIKNIEPLAGLVNLKVLNLTDNNIEDISSLVELKNLEYLYLQINEIKDISILLELPELKILDIDDNNVLNTLEGNSFCEIINILKEKGVKVEY